MSEQIKPDLILNMKREWFAKIWNGEKTVEYRDFTEYNLKRTIGLKTIRFNRGYGHPGQPPAQMRWEVKKVMLQDAADSECDPQSVPKDFVPVRIAIHLGKQLT